MTLTTDTARRIRSNRIERVRAALGTNGHLRAFNILENSVCVGNRSIRHLIFKSPLILRGSNLSQVLGTRWPCVTSFCFYKIGQNDEYNQAYHSQNDTNDK